MVAPACCCPGGPYAPAPFSFRAKREGGRALTPTLSQGAREPGGEGAGEDALSPRPSPRGRGSMGDVSGIPGCAAGVRGAGVVGCCGEVTDVLRTRAGAERVV